MRQVVDGKLYDQRTMTALCSVDDYYERDICGSRILMMTRMGRLVMVTTSNGRDPRRIARIQPISLDEAEETIKGWPIADDEIERLLAQGLIKEAR